MRQMSQKEKDWKEGLKDIQRTLLEVKRDPFGKLSPKDKKELKALKRSPLGVKEEKESKKYLELLEAQNVLGRKDIIFKLTKTIDRKFEEQYEKSKELTEKQYRKALILRNIMGNRIIRARKNNSKFRIL